MARRTSSYGVVSLITLYTWLGQPLHMEPLSHHRTVRLALQGPARGLPAQYLDHPLICGNQVSFHLIWGHSNQVDSKPIRQIYTHLCCVTWQKRTMEVILWASRLSRSTRPQGRVGRPPVALGPWSWGTNQNTRSGPRLGPPKPGGF